MLLTDTPPQGAQGLAEDERQIAVQHVLESLHFCRSPRLSRLLLYLSEQTLCDRPELLTEHTIACNVFERGTGFDPSVDTIVRSHMVRLRQKLDQYSAENASPIRIHVPKGEYVVRFERQMQDQSEPALISSQQTQGSSTAAKQKNPLFLVCVLLGLAVIGLLAALLTMLYRSHRGVAAATVAHPLWSHFFQPRQTTTFIAADSGLVMLHRLTGRDTTLAEYLNRDFSQATRGLPPDRAREAVSVANRRYTSFVDMTMFQHLEHLPYANTGKLELQYARDIQMDGLKQGNIILSGSRGANPWLELYEPQLNFVGVSDNVHHMYTFVNRHPQAGEAGEYSVSGSDPKQRALGVLAFLPNLDGHGNILIAEGNSIEGTEATSDFLFNDAVLLPFLNQIKRPDGSLPHFEVLIESNSVNGSAGPFHIVASRVYS